MCPPCPLLAAEARPIIADVIEGLLFLHGKGVYHLDVKPDNVLLKDGIAKLADLGASLTAEEMTS